MINRVFLLGTVANEPKSNSACIFFNLLTWNKWNGKEYKTWTKIDVFGKTREVLGGLSEGELVCIEGKINHSSYERNGQKIKSTSVVANSVTRMGSSSASQVNQETQANPHVVEAAQEPDSYPPKPDDGGAGKDDFPW